MEKGGRRVAAMDAGIGGGFPHAVPGGGGGGAAHPGVHPPGVPGPDGHGGVPDDAAFRRGAGGVRLIRLKRSRGEDAAESITMRVRKRTDTKEQDGLAPTRGIELQRVEFDPGNPGVLLQAPRVRLDRRDRFKQKVDYDPRPTNPQRRQDTRHELKEGLRNARLVKFLERRSGGGATATPGSAAVGGGAPPPQSDTGGEALLAGGVDGGAASDDIQIFDIVEMVAQDRAKTASSKYSDITCNDAQLERVLMRLSIDEKTGFTKRQDPKGPSQLRKGKSRPSWLEDDEDDEGEEVPPTQTDGAAAATEEESKDIYDLYILPEHESLLEPGAEYWIDAGEEQFVAEEAEGLTDESDDPDAKEIDYDDEYAESDEGEDSRDGYGIHGDDGLEAEYRGYSY